MTTETESRAGHRAALWIAAVLSIGWLILFAWLMRQRFAVEPSADAVAGLLGDLVAPALIPVATLFAIAAALRRPSLPAVWPPVMPEDSLMAAEADLTGSVARVDTVRALLAADLANLSETSAALGRQAAQFHEEAARIGADAATLVDHARALGAHLPEAARQAEQMAASIAESGGALERQTAQLVSASDDLAAHIATAGRSAADAADMLEAAQGRIAQGIADLAARSAADSAAMDDRAAAALAATQAATAAMRTDVSQQIANLDAALANAHSALDRMGRESAEAVGRMLDGLLQQAAAIEERIAAQSAATDHLATSAERSFQLLDKRLSLSASSTRQTLDQLAQQVGQVNDAADAVAQPLREGRVAAVELSEAVGALRETVMQTIDAMAATLPARTVEATKASETMAAELSALMARMDAAADKARLLAEPIAEGRASIELAAGEFVKQREAMAVAGQALVVELEQARQLIAEVEQQTETTSLAASTRLVDAMSQVRAVAQQAAGTMRETLAGVIAEARESLSATAADATRRSFAEPIAQQAREADALAAAAADRAREASERTAASLLALAGSLRSIEERTATTDNRLDNLVRQDLNASAALLTDRMAASSAAILDALGKPLSDEDIARWRKGERGLFGQRAVALLSKADMSRLKADLAADPVFQSTARQHVLEFDALVARMGEDGPLARALRQTDMGRIAMLLSDALSA